MARFRPLTKRITVAARDFRRQMGRTEEELELSLEELQNAGTADVGVGGDAARRHAAGPV